MIQPPRPRWMAQADAACARLNQLLLGVALALAVVTVSGQQHPRTFAAVVARLDWLSPPMDPKTGLLSEQFGVPAADR